MIATKSPRSIRRETSRSARHLDRPEVVGLRDSRDDDRRRAACALPSGASARSTSGRSRACRTRRPRCRGSRRGITPGGPPPGSRLPPGEAAAAEPAAEPAAPRAAASRGGRSSDEPLPVVAVGSTTSSPAFRPLRMIVELSPASPVVTRWVTCLPPRTTVTASAFDGARGDVQAFGLLDDHFGGGAHPDFQACGFLVELEGDVVADRAAAARRDLADA